MATDRGGEGWGDDVYRPDPADEQADVDQLDDQDTLIQGVGDPLDEGYSPPERLMGMRSSETLDERLADELPDVQGADPGDGMGDVADTDGELRDDEVGDRRSGRLIAWDEGGPDDRDTDLLARDVGIDGAGASAEEAAMHVVEDE